MYQLKVIAAAAALAVAPAVASASIILDDFSVDQIVADDPIGGILTTNTVGDRTFTVDNRTAEGPFKASLESGFAPNALLFGNDPGVNGIATVDWTFAGLDLSSQGYFQIDLVSFDLVDHMAEIGLTVNGVTVSRDIGDEDIGALSFGFGSFAGVDFSNVTTLSLFIDAVNAAALDASFDNLRVEPVPLPAAGLMLLGALGALGAAKRRKA